MDPRSPLGVYLDQSLCHTRDMALVLHKKSLYVSPQHHIVFDEYCSIVIYLIADDILPNWSVWVNNSPESITDKGVDLASTWCNDTSVYYQVSLSNKEDIDNYQYDSVASHSVSFTNPLVEDILHLDYVLVSEEDQVSISEEEPISAPQGNLYSIRWRK